jgi:hypothetical protein
MKLAERRLVHLFSGNPLKTVRPVLLTQVFPQHSLSMHSNLRSPFGKARKDRAGIALVIVLAFVVLLTVLVMTLLSRSLSNGLISGASVNFSKTELYGHGAVNQIIGDLRQEIMAGSQISGVSPQTIPVTGAPAGAPPVIIYRPSVFVAAAPYRSGPYSATSAIWATLPNLVKESARTVAFYPSSYDANAPTRAAAINSSTDSSINGRYVSLARWNKHLLLPKASATITAGTSTTPTTIADTGSTDTTPTDTFIAPDWILTAADGSNPTTLDTSASLTTSNINPQSPKYVIGRYAYAIYNEGGLLDANVAGCPAPTGSSTFQATNASNSPWTQTTALAKKGPSAFADLTQLPGIANVSSFKPQTVVDQLVGWRNFASAQPTGTFPSYSPLNSLSINNYFTYLLQLNTRFMSIGNPAAPVAASDHLFSSRQQLISFFQDIAIVNGNTNDQAYLQDAMMYLGTFSRTLNQPSYWPDPNRPKVVSLGYQTSGAYSGGNDSFGNDIGTTPPYKGIYNPPFGAIRAGSAFTRNDLTTAIVGEPLVKKRFALNRLCWITYMGPSVNLPTSDPVYKQFINDGISPQLLGEGTPANILKYFGLTWFDGSGTQNGTAIGGYWKYNHTINSGQTVPVLAAVVTAVKATPREPDFFEILQAAVNIGSIAKGWNDTAGGDDGTVQAGTPFDPPLINSQTTFQVLQLGANIIDEVNPTQYPTHIEFNPPGGVWSIYGATDLPYFFGTKTAAFIAQPPTPASADGSAVTPVVDPETSFPSHTGAGVMMYIPIIWNPYDQTGPAAVTGPKNLRIVVGNVYTPTSTFAVDPLATTPWTENTNVVPFLVYGQHAPGATVPASSSSAATPMVSDQQLGSFPSATYSPNPNWISEDSSALTFSNVIGSTLYRQPTALAEAGVPAGSNLGLGSGNIIPTAGTQAGANWSQGIPENGGTGQTLLGFFMGSFPLRWNGSENVSATSANPNGTSTTFTFTVAEVLPTSAPQGLTIRLEYLPPGGSTWIPYREYYTYPEHVTMPFPLTELGTSSSPGLLTPSPASPSQTNANQAFSASAGAAAYPNAGSLWNGNYSACDANAADALNGGSGNPMYNVWDPRTPRWGGMFDMPTDLLVDASNTVLTVRPDASTPNGLVFNHNDFNAPGDGWHSENNTSIPWDPGAYCQNIQQGGGVSYYEDADGVVRRGMAGLASPTSTPLAFPSNSTTGSRPIMLHRPFRSVAELGYVFSDTPWKNIDFFNPESGDGGLLDAFCINEDYRPDAVEAGRVDLNTQQAPVIQALLAGAYRDETAGSADTTLATSEAATISNNLVNWTSPTNPLNTNASGKGPLANIADLVGRWKPGSSISRPINGSTSYAGFTSTLGASSTSPNGSYTGGATSVNNQAQRYVESSMRALSDAGQAGTWNLLIDVIAQSGRYPINTSSTNMAGFLVEGERHYWVHVAIDRTTGQVIDENIEVVNE